MDFKLQYPLPSLYQTFQLIGFFKNILDEKEDLLESMKNLFIMKDSPPGAREELVEEEAEAKELVEEEAAKFDMIIKLRS